MYLFCLFQKLYFRVLSRHESIYSFAVFLILLKCDKKELQLPVHRVLNFKQDKVSLIL